jgi:putative DNA primase/helicase
LRLRGYFCTWRYDERGGKKTKVPFNQVSGGGAETNRKNSFCEFDTAVQTISQYDGIGFLIADGLFVIDLDHCFNRTERLTRKPSKS